MRVLHIITGLGDGGAEAVLYRLVTQDRQDKHHVVSLTGAGKYGPWLQQAGIGVTTLGMPRGRVTWHGLTELRRAIETFQPDVVQTWMYHADLLGGLMAKTLGRPVVWGLRNTTLEPGKSSRATIWVAQLCGRLSRWVPQRIVACAQAAVRVHARLGYDAARMVVIPNGYDLAQFRPDPSVRARLRAEWALPEGVPLLGMVGRWDPYKDHANLITALGQLSQEGHDFRLALVGTGMTADNEALLALLESAALQEKTLLLGLRNDVPAVMTAFDLHVLSSAAEAFPNVLAEAMACGTPCVTTDVGDAAQIVGDTGWIVPPRDSGALAQALRRASEAWRDGEAWQTRQAACRARIEHAFGIEKMVDRYRAVWEEAIQARLTRMIKHTQEEENG
ncbi:glycosyltransferase [uncultured Thermosynechococcus sp.]|uniref:glycosyltransferase family 4 protein n=1 Tax=uncultured Thermosynechococcus sp. TaxID=436945 RepID=UPI0026144520|nr:glycosyltransferase [uncultured Thermosynechococcus sp.]